MEFFKSHDNLRVRQKKPTKHSDILKQIKISKLFFSSPPLNRKQFTIIKFCTEDVDVGQFTNKIIVVGVSSSTPKKIGSIFFGGGDSIIRKKRLRFIAMVRFKKNAIVFFA